MTDDMSILALGGITGADAETAYAQYLEQKPGPFGADAVRVAVVLGEDVR